MYFISYGSDHNYNLFDWYIKILFCDMKKYLKKIYLVLNFFYC